MKKAKIFITIIVLLLIAYFGQIFYMGSLNQKIFEKLSQNNEFYNIKNIKFDKGFFNSYASFDMNFKNYEKINFTINFVLHNNIFASKNLEAYVKNPFKLLEKALKSDELAKLELSTKLGGKAKLDFKINDINLSNEGGSFLLQNAYGSYILNEESKILNSNFNMDKMHFGQFYNQIEFNNIDYKEEFEGGVDFKNLGEFFESKNELNILSAKIDNLKLSQIRLLSSSTNDNNATFKGDLNLSIAKLSTGKILDFKEENFNDIKLDLKFDKIPKQTYLDNFNFSNPNFIENFISFNPKIKLEKFSFSKGDKKLNASANFETSAKGYKLSAKIQSDAKISELLPWTSLFGNLDSFFIQKNNLFVLDYLLDNSDLNKPKIYVNGDELNSRLIFN